MKASAKKSSYQSLLWLVIGVTPFLAPGCGKTGVSPQTTTCTLSSTSDSIDDPKLAAPLSQGFTQNINADPLGNLYAVGTYANAAVTTVHWVVRKSTDAGKTWSASDEITTNTGPNTNPMSVFYDKFTTVYVAGSLDDGAGTTHWTVRQSLDRGNTWTTVDDYFVAGKTASAWSGTSDSKGNLFVGGQYQDAAGKFHWLIRTSAKGLTGTWTTVKDVTLTSSQSNAAFGLSADTTGNVYAVGSQYVAGPGVWTILKSADAGATWTNLDLGWQYCPTQNGAPYNFLADAAGNLFVGGTVNECTTGNGHWLVKTSKDAGLTWTVADDYFPTATPTFSYGMVGDHGLIQDTFGHYYAAGKTISGTVGKWVVRQSVDAGKTWSILETVSTGSTFSASAMSLATDFFNNVFVAGSYIDSANASHWSVRKYGCK